MARPRRCAAVAAWLQLACDAMARQGGGAKPGHGQGRFIGSPPLRKLLLDEGWEVWALDDLSTGSLANVEHLTGNADFHLVVDSVLNRAVVNELVQV